MRRIALVVLATALAASAAGAVASPGPFVTLYSRDLGFVRETRTLGKGFLANTIDVSRLEDVSTRLDFSSVRVVPASGRVTRLAYRWDVASGDAMIEHSVGERVRVLSREHQVAEGTLLSADGSWLVIRTEDGGLATLNRGSVDAVQMAGVPAAFSLKPTIEVALEGMKGSTPAELSYLTGGLSWNAEHLLVRTGETSAVWSTRVIVENATGRDYVNATVKLVAGEPSRASAPMPKPAPMLMRAMDASAGAEADMTEASFSEYHLYTLNAPATLRDRESQSLVMIDPRPVTVTPRYVVRGGDAQGVLAQLELVNSAKAGPGVPLPAGRVRTFELDDSGALQFTGERNVGHTAVDEKLTIDVGYAFDLAAERRQTTETRPSDRERQYGMEIKLRNRKNVPVKIVVEEPVGGDVAVTQQSHPSTRKDANTLQWTIDVPVGKEVVLTYTARQRW